MFFNEKKKKSDTEEFLDVVSAAVFFGALFAIFGGLGTRLWRIILALLVCGAGYAAWNYTTKTDTPPLSTHVVSTISSQNSPRTTRFCLATPQGEIMASLLKSDNETWVFEDGAGKIHTLTNDEMANTQCKGNPWAKALR
jgi:hypothetical protein